MGDGDDRCGYGGGLSGSSSFGKDSDHGQESDEPQRKPSSRGDSDGVVVFHNEARDSNASLAASDVVVFPGDDSRLELFPTDDVGRAISSRTFLLRPARHGLIGYLDRFRNKCSVDMMYICVLSFLSIVIVLVLILDA
uniref:Protein m41 n=1 Tax=Mastomys natalensis cytomegalovirus 2 TaxID=2973540 RepID=A0A9Y1N6W6_9BETA|nr:protein m41 [Mastomys natalensis cytomegalovirus 2]WEG69183.1 protein m41 [Mastomys natalensis cytomegalovirus 2]WEG69322.1 protein m41 [Mastomys natalensis cytomegalovirus 2]WEG69460.1 protein m41 [Mastomys natalensis cytomegalovirus 2]WEG69598.1 protein m41 [Mastomys natalensis cytomegalovirus 2]